MAISSKEKKEKNQLKADKRKRMLKLAVWCATLPPYNHDDPAQVRARIGLYFDKCIETGSTIGKEGLCNALGITRSTFQSWLNGTARKGQDHQKICQDAEQVLKAYTENAMLDGDINPVPGIFFMSNQYDYVQKQVIQSNESQSILDTATPEQLEHRYGDGMIIDAIYSESEEMQKKELAQSNISHNKEK